MVIRMDDGRRTALALIAVALALVLAVSCTPKGDSEVAEMKYFSSADDISAFLAENVQEGGYYDYGGFGGIRSLGAPMAMMKTSAVMAESAAGAGPAQSASDYSTTNIQVEGVDEADIVKNDGSTIYAVTGQNVAIVRAFPADSMEVLSSIELDFTPQELFISGDRLVILGTGYRQARPVVAEGGDDGEDGGEVDGQTAPSAGGAGIAAKEIGIMPPYPYYDRTVEVARVLVYDVSDRSAPEEVRDLTADGTYFDSRMIGDDIYVIATQSVWYVKDRPVPLPLVMEDGVERAIPASEIAYFPVPDTSYTFTNILTLDVTDDDAPADTNVYMMGSAQTMYVSQDNIYIVYQRYLPYYYTEERIFEATIDALPKAISDKMREVVTTSSAWERYQEQQDIYEEYLANLSADEQEELAKRVEANVQEAMRQLEREQEQTHIHRLAIADGEVTYAGKGRVPGRVLNQFSMDESEGYFRIATTTGHLSRSAAEATSANHVYVLDADLDIVGALQDLAPGESIYSVRFMGERAYIVTFKKVDPLFVLDLSDPTNPRVLGQLKIPGYSDYLHPYDEDHIIGIGKGAVEAEEGDFAWYQGVKMSLFDVSDVSVPKEISKVEIGDRGTDSDALYDHKDFLFSRSKNLLVIPVRLAEIDERKYPAGVEPNTYGDFTFQGAYVYSLGLEDGFVYKGRVTHLEDLGELDRMGYYWYGYGKDSIKRSLYMEDVLYTVSDGKIKANSLDTLDEISTVKLPYEEPDTYGRYYLE